MIGFFANTLVMKTDLTANPSFQEVLERVIWQLRNILQVDIPLRKIFEEPTLAGFAAVVQQQTQMSTTVDVIPRLNRDDTEDLLMQVDQMSAEEIDLLLNDLLEE